MEKIGLLPIDKSKKRHHFPLIDLQVENGYKLSIENQSKNSQFQKFIRIDFFRGV